MQFYFRQFSGDESVASMDLDTVGAHILLMCYVGASKHLFKIEFSDEKLRRILRGVSDENWSRIKQQLLSAWEVSEDGKWLVQNGMKRSLAKRKAFCDKQRERANARWANAKKIPEACRNDTGSDAESVPKTCSASTSTFASTYVLDPNGSNTTDPYPGGYGSVPPTLPNQPKIEPKKTALAPKLLVTESEHEKLLSEFGPESVKYYTQVCSDYLVANGRAMKNAAAFMRNWIRREIAERKGFYYQKFQNGAKTQAEKNLEYLKNRMGELENESEDACEMPSKPKLN